MAALLKVVVPLLDLFGYRRKAEEAQKRLDALRRKKEIEDEVATGDRRRTAHRFVRKRDE